MASSISDSQLSRLRVVLLLSAMWLFSGWESWSYPEYQAYISKSSHRSVDCAYCHSHSDGPEGTAYGQIGSLTPDQIKRLQEGRAAFDPGHKVDNPLLNAFGNHIIENIGKKKFLELRLTPSRLADELDPKSDLDQDGIPDVEEVRDGTHPLIKSDGRPWLLFRHNVLKYRGELAATLIGTLAGLYGLRHLLRGFAVVAPARNGDDEDHDSEAQPR